VQKHLTMKQIIIIVSFFLSFSIKSQKGDNPIITTTLAVKGNCEQCKKRIDNAADIKGVKFFEWNETAKVAKVIYDSRKTNLETIEKAIAAKGYDTPNQTGDKNAYDKLPGCCRYRGGICSDKK
jgi:hypothetical protein